MIEFHIDQAVRTLNKGGVIAYPTEAVFGLGCYPEDFFSIMKILSLKKRPLEKGLILIAADAGQINAYVKYPDHKIKHRVHSTWPGPITWILPASNNAPTWITGYRESIAVRVSAHPVVQLLCSRVGAIVSTSANPVNRQPARSSVKVRSYFGGEIDYILPGETGDKNLPTEIRESVTGKVLRNSD